MKDKTELNDVSFTTKIQASQLEKLRSIADSLGISMSSMTRMLIYKQIRKVEESGNAVDFFNLDGTEDNK